MCFSVFPNGMIRDFHPTTNATNRALTNLNCAMKLKHATAPNTSYSAKFQKKNRTAVPTSTPVNTISVAKSSAANS